MTESGIVRLEVTAAQVAQLDAIAGDLSTHCSAMPEYVFFDLIRARRQEARDALPELTIALDDLALHGATKVVVAQLPESTSTPYGLTPNADTPADRNLFPGDAYRALFVSMPNVDEGRGLYAFSSQSREGGVLQNNLFASPGRALRYETGRAALLDLHTDGLFINRNQGQEPDTGDRERNASPDFLALHFIRNDEEAPLLVSIPDWSQISKATKDICVSQF